jgi:fructose-specific phosphotransferase system IIC component
MTNISITALIIGSMVFGGIAAEVGIAIKCPHPARRVVCTLPLI